MKKRIMSVVLTVVMLLALVPVSAFADSDVINVTAANAQEVLNGNISGKTINFTENIPYILSLAPEKYNASHNISDVTFTADEGVKLVGIKFTAWKGDYKDKQSKIKTVKRIIFDGLTFDDSIAETALNYTDFNASVAFVINKNNLRDGKSSSVTSIAFDGCTFIGSDPTKLEYGIEFNANAGQFGNIVVTNCNFENYNLGILIRNNTSTPAENFDIYNNTFSDMSHSAISFQAKSYGGEITIQENFIDGTGDRPIRITSIVADTEVAINNNIMINTVGDPDTGSEIKFSSISSDATVDLENNYWDGQSGSTAVENEGFAPESTGIIGGDFGDNEVLEEYLANDLTLGNDGGIYTDRTIAIANGTASADIAVKGDVICIDADDILGGKQFMYWEITTSDGCTVQFVRGGKSTETASFIMPDCDVTITAVYRAVLPMFMHTIIVVDSDNGTTSPTGIMLVMQGLSHKFTFTPDEGYEVADVLINGESVGAVDSYRLTVNEFVNTVEAIYAPVDNAN